MMGEMMNGMMWFGAIFWLLLAALLIVGIVVLIRTLGEPSRGRRGATTSAVQILEERFARGEIDMEEFEERRRALDS